MKTFIINGGLNPQYKIDIEDLTITTGCRTFYYRTLEDLLEGIEELIKEIKEIKGDK